MEWENYGDTNTHQCHCWSNIVTIIFTVDFFLEIFMYGPLSMMCQDFHRCHLTTELTMMDTTQLNLLQMKYTSLVSSESSCSECE